MFDRIDMHIEVPAVATSDLRLPPPAEGSAEVAERLARARDIQTRRYRELATKGQIIRSNSEADSELLQAVEALMRRFQGLAAYRSSISLSLANTRRHASARRFHPSLHENGQTPHDL